MYKQFKNAFWAIALLACFPLYSLGQVLLYLQDQNQRDFYNIITKNASSWVNSHLILMFSLLLMIPAYLGIGAYLRNRNYPIWFGISFFFLILSIFSMFGQFTIDLCLVEIFKLPRDESFFILEKIKTNKVIEALFYDNSKLFFLLKYLDFWFLSQIALAAAFLTARKLPKWELAIFFVALLLTQLGPVIDPFYGKVIKRVAYTLLSFAYFPIAVALFKNKKNNSAISEI